MRFANSTEESFASLLRSLRLRWQYEPHTFVLRTRPDGTPALAFTPDFYLPDLEMYVELPTRRQKLVTLKNRKARLLTEQHPDVRLRLLYRRDCQEILTLGRSRRSREVILRRLWPTPPEEVLDRLHWQVYLRRTGDSAGRVSVMGVRLPLGLECAGRKLDVWVYGGRIEVEWGDTVIARFPCTYEPRSHTLEWVGPGELLDALEIEQQQLALPELERTPLPGRRARGWSKPGHVASQLPLPL